MIRRCVAGDGRMLMAHFVAWGDRSWKVLTPNAWPTRTRDAECKPGLTARHTDQGASASVHAFGGALERASARATRGLAPSHVRGRRAFRVKRAGQKHAFTVAPPPAPHLHVGSDRRLPRLASASLPRTCAMRRKTAPPQPPKKRARSPSAVERVAASPAALHWAHAEWFQSTIDEPYFIHSDFHAVVASRMVQLSDMLSTRLTRLQLARIRAAMCNMLPGGFVQPRRFSSSFLFAEREELSMYRNDARRVLRGLDLLPSIDPTTGDALPQIWWSRHRCGPPRPLQRGAQVLVRTFSSPLNGQKLAQLHIRPAIFLSLEADCQNRIRFQDDATEHVVSDLDVMWHPSSSIGSDSIAQSPLLPNVHSLAPSPGSPPFPFSPSAMPTPVFDFTHFPEASQSVIQLYQSPRPTLISPRKTLEVKGQCGDGYECEVDFHRIAESMQLLDRKEQLLSSLKMLNDAVSTTTTPGEPPSESAQAKYDSILAALDQVNAEIGVHIEPDRSTPHPSPPKLYISADMESAKLDETPEKNQSLPVTLLKIAPNSPIVAKKEGGSPGGTVPRSPQLRSENMAKNVDFRSAAGTALLAKALTKAALAKLHPDHGIKSAPTPIRADVMECVSACVAVLIRARTTRDLHCVEELIDGLRSRFPSNSEAIDAIHAAARVLDTGSSDSA
ncbi:proline-rich receptor-like protein kinase PERK8 [Gracilaria domingensis]|nr:proline-rich receptor-like protein kinase PERK8 [Gracilaria domingensis]